MKQFSHLLFSTLIILSIGCRKEGCTDELATNYNSQANYDNGSCDYIMGCTDTAAINYNAEAAISDESCQSFANWENWILNEVRIGPDSVIGFAHLGGDSNTVREIYINQELILANGEYPEGTMIFKRSEVPDTGTVEYVGMVKLPAGTAPESSDWEWFMLNQSGSIAKDGLGDPLRGPNLLNGMCTGCHNQAVGDMVFTN